MSKEIKELNKAIRILRNFCKKIKKKSLDCCSDGDDAYACPFLLKCPVHTDDAPCYWSDLEEDEK